MTDQRQTNFAINCVAEWLFLVYFGPFLVPVRPHLGHSESCKWPKLVCLDVPILLNHFQPKIGPLGQFMWPKGYFSLLWPLFGPHRATFGTFLVLQMAQTGLSVCPHWCSNLVSPVPTQNRPSELICVAKKLF